MICILFSIQSFNSLRYYVKHQISSGTLMMELWLPMRFSIKDLGLPYRASLLRIKNPTAIMGPIFWRLFLTESKGSLYLLCASSWHFLIEFYFILWCSCRVLGPDGGDGGSGGHIIARATRHAKSFSHLKRVVVAENGVDGKIKCQHGKTAKHTYLPVCYCLLYKLVFYIKYYCIFNYIKSVR